VLLLGPPGSSVVGDSAAAAERWAVPVERLDAAGLRARFPTFAVGPDDVGLWEPGGGFLRPEASVRAALTDAEAHGAAVRTGAAVLGIEEHTGGVRVHLEGETLEAGALVVTAGAWTARLLPELAGVLCVTRQVQAWVRPDDPAVAAPGRLPCWLIDRGAAPPLYGIPVDPRAPGPPLAKVAVHGSDRVVAPDHLSRDVTGAERDALAALAARHLPGLRGPLLAARTCMYTQTPDEHFIVDRAPGMRRTVVVAGLSGHGFKLCPALGRAAAELAATGRTDLPVGFLGLERLRA
jgi:sarcosine oxidase